MPRHVEERARAAARMCATASGCSSCIRSGCCELDVLDDKPLDVLLECPEEEPWLLDLL